MPGRVFNSAIGGAARGGGVDRPPTKPVRGERWLECPVCAMRVAEGDMVFTRGRLVCSMCDDAPGYREMLDEEGSAEDIRPSEREPFSVDEL